MVNNVMLEPKAVNGTVQRPSHEVRKVSSSRGIMTLTRTPCELDTMSLFQDLKLKRRKVDSRCSSDGESVAETSTSSPDMAGPSSPCPKLASTSPEPELSLRERTPEGEARFKMGDGELPSVKEEGDNGVFDGGGNEGAVEENKIETGEKEKKTFKEEAVSEGKGVSCNEDGVGKIEREPAGDVRLPNAGIEIKQEEAGIQQEQRSQPNRRQDEKETENRGINRLGETSEDVRSSREREGNEASDGTECRAGKEDETIERDDLCNREIRENRENVRSCRETEWNRSDSVSNVSSDQERNTVISDKDERSERHERQWHSPVTEKWHGPVSSERIKYPPAQSERVIVERQHPNPSVLERAISSPDRQRIKTSPESKTRSSPDRSKSCAEQIRARPSPERQQSRAKLSPEQQQRSSPLIHRNSPAAQRQVSAAGDQASSVISIVSPGSFWMSPTSGGRINGVRPELIGGNVNVNAAFPSHVQGTDMKPPRTIAVPVSSGGSRQTPTVIMGEAGGVRTMIWTQPNPASSPETSPQNIAASTSTVAWSTSSQSSAGGGSSNSSEESAAQLLLNLGQSDRQPLQQNQQQPQQPQHQQQSQPHHHPHLHHHHHHHNHHQQQQQHHPQQHHHLQQLPHSQPHQSPPHPQQPQQQPQQPPPQAQQQLPSTPSQPQQDQTHSHYSQPLNMERLWAGDLTQLPASQQNQALNLAMPSGAWPRENKPQGMTVITDAARHDPEDEDQPMICMICEDRATGLHYGIITCEGCKGFFKRTVQNRRVYTCVADGNCEITKAQRNRCQYCRFKKCIEQGMVLQAVREDRMPGGRNSGAVYNLYKVKYKKHKKNPKNGQVKGGSGEKMNQQKSSILPEQNLPSHVVNGTILKTALTNPSEVVHLRQRFDNTVSSSRDRTFPLDTILSMIQALVDCDEFQDIATLRNLEDLLDHKSDLSDKLCQIGDSIVYKLVQWTKRLPFYLELPVEVHTRLLTHKWHELLVLTTSAYQAIHGVHKLSSTSTAGHEADFTQEVSNNLVTLQTCLTSMMGRPITMDQLRQDVGLMVEKITHVTLMFRRVKLRMEEYVCLKVITMLNQGRGGSSELEVIQDRYMMCLRSYVEHSFPQQPARFHELLLRLPEIQSAATLLLESKMFYVPFLLNSAIQR